MNVQINGSLFVTSVGLKHAFSAIVGFYSNSLKHHEKIKNVSFGKFTNIFLKTDLNSFVLEKNTCKFCSLFDLKESSMIDELTIKFSSSLQEVKNIDKKYLGPNYLANLQVLLRKAGQELQNLVYFE